MRKGTILKYELKRLLLSKEYLLILAAVFVYGLSLLRSLVLYGTDYTAPFSMLTYMTYCSSLAPFFFVLLMVLCARQFKTSEKGAEAIISAAPIPQHVFKLLRYGAIGCAFLIASALPVIACIVFYIVVFNYMAVGPLFWTEILAITPPAIFLFGAATLFGSKKTGAVYVLLAVVLILGVFQIHLPAAVDIFGGTAIRRSDISVYDSSLTAGFLIGRAVLTLVGSVLITASCGVRPDKWYVINPFNL